MIKNDNDKNESRISEDQPERKSRPKNGLSMFLIVTASLVILLSLASLAANIYIFNRQLTRSNRDIGITTFDFNRHEGIGGGEMMMRGYSWSSSTNGDVISGVVVAVGDNSFTIAGHGKQYTVKTNANTDFNTSDNRVSINDSVVVYGDLSDTTITASDVNVLNS